MRIGIFTRRFWPFSGALEQEAADVAQAIAEAGHAVEVLTIHWEKNWPRSFQFREVQVTRFSRGLGGPWGMFRFLRELSRHVRAANLDGLIVYGLADECWAVLRSVQSDIPVELRTDRSEWNSFLSRRFHFRQKRFLNQLSRILTEAENTREAMLEYGVTGEVVSVIPPCVSLAKDFERSLARRSLIRSSLTDAHPILEVDPNLPLALCASDLNDSGIETLLSAWKLVVRQLPRARLWILGEGQSQARLWQRIGDGVLSKSIVLPGQFDELDDILVAADVYVHAAVSGQSCHRLVRALATGACVVAIANEFSLRWMEDQRDGLLSQPDDPAELAQRLIRALSDSELRVRLGAGARETGKQFLTENWLSRFLELTQPHQKVAAPQHQ